MFKNLVGLSISMSLLCSASYAQELSSTSEENMVPTNTSEVSTILSPAFKNLLSSDELHFNLVLSQQGLHNKQPVTLYRFEPGHTLSLDQENVSFLIKKDSGDLQGFVRLWPAYAFSNQQVSKEEAINITQAFLEKYAPDLLVNYKNDWIDRHDEVIVVEGKKVTLTGMKVKCRDLNTGLYFWTVIAPDQSVMIFEKDVEWDFIKAGRQTQKWLHDSWLKKQLPK